jgi:hypothetical protein
LQPGKEALKFGSNTGFQGYKKIGIFRKVMRKTKMPKLGNNFKKVNIYGARIWDY